VLAGCRDCNDPAKDCGGNGAGNEGYWDASNLAREHSSGCGRKAVGHLGLGINRAVLHFLTYANSVLQKS
jgi:hypothetical protein